MNKTIFLPILLLISSIGFSQAPEIWGTAKSTINSTNYIIYKTDTSLNNPVSTVKTLSTSTDGIPNGSLVKGIYDTLIYGVTFFPGGSFNIFQINTATNVYTLKYQTTSAMQGEEIVGELMRHPNGKYYGMTNGGGANSKGVIFEWDPVFNAYNVKHHFNGTDGSHPRSNASLRYCSTDGYFYGLTISGGTANYGVLFRYNPTSNLYQVVTNFTYNNGIEPNGSVQILEHANGDLNILYTLMYANSSNWGTLCNTKYTSSSGNFTTTFESFAGLYFYNNSLQLNNPIGELVRLKYNNANNDPQYIGIAGNSTQNSYVVYSFAIDNTTRQIYTNTTLSFVPGFPTHQSIRTADNFVQSDLGNGIVYGVTNGLSFNNPNGSYLRKYYPLNGDFATSLNIYSTQNLSHEVFGGRPYVHTYTPCVPASTPVLSGSASNVCNNNAVTLTISSGTLNNSTDWKWYSGSCGGTLIGTGTSITVNQSTTTTYFARGEGGCSTNGNCGTITIYCVPGGTELFFSEYVEGSSNNKALEIFNPTIWSIDLSDYSIEVYTNGSSTVSITQPLSGNLAPGDVYVVVHPSALGQFISVSDITSTVCNFNGDDAVVLAKNGVAVDIIGVIGVDPGSSWTVSGGGTTAGYTLVRDSMVTGPEINWNVAQNQWYSYPSNTSIYLGYHDMSNVIANISSGLEINNEMVYPNPGNGIVLLRLPKKSEVVITNSLGEIVYKTQESATDFKIDISGYPAGIYYIKAAGKVMKYLKM